MFIDGHVVVWWGRWDLTVIDGGATFQSAHLEPFRSDYPRGVSLLRARSHVLLDPYIV